MTDPLAELIEVTFVADENTPPDVAGRAGKKVALKPAELAAANSGPANPRRLFGILGHIVPQTDPPQFLMTQKVPPALHAEFNNIPGALGWRDDSARARYRQVGEQLMDAGIIPADVIAALRVLYRAARDNLVATPT